MSISSVGSTFTYQTTASPLVRRQTGAGAPGSSSEKAATSSSVSQQNPSVTSPEAPDKSAESSSLQDSSKDKEIQGELSEEEKKEVRKLEKRDVEVRTHEQAHLAAAGQYAASGANFDFQTGPDGKRYAVGGDVSISVSNEQTPEATIAKMQVVVRAAMAPAEPSAQDHRVAAEASQKAAAARRELSAAQTDPESQDASLEKTAQKTAEQSSDAGSILPQQARGAGFDAIAERARSTGAQRAYEGAAPINHTVDWTA